MVGLNSELGRELLWRGYPTDQRGTSFRQFWDATAAGAGDHTDIPPVHEWDGRELGANTRRCWRRPPRAADPRRGASGGTPGS